MFELCCVGNPRILLSSFLLALFSGCSERTHWDSSLLSKTEPIFSTLSPAHFFSLSQSDDPQPVIRLALTDGKQVFWDWTKKTLGMHSVIWHVHDGRSFGKQSFTALKFNGSLSFVTESNAWEVNISLTSVNHSNLIFVAFAKDPLNFTLFPKLLCSFKNLIIISAVSLTSFRAS